MYEEQYLISTGMPLDAALTLCHTLRREGELETFMKEYTRDVCKLQSFTAPQAGRRLHREGHIKSA